MDPNFSYQFYKTTSEAWDAMSEAILSAKRSIYWEVYIFIDDSIGEKFVNLLAEKAREGLEVKIVIDAFGSAEFSEKSEKLLKEAGAEILKFNRIYRDWRIHKFLQRLLYRNHRKVLIIDERIVFLGGVNIKAHYKTWDDIYLKISGKVAKPLLRGFAKSYISAGGDRKKVTRLLHPKWDFSFPLWREKFKFIVHSPTMEQIPRTKKFFLTSLKMAKDTVNLLTPYYVPDKQFLKAVATARKRGVKVNIFMPLRPDLKIFEYIARTYYELTVKAGGNIFLLPNMHHGKALSVDNKVGMVGSINLTPRSFTHNEESAVRFTDEQMVADLNSLFNSLKLQAQQFDLKSFEKQNLLQRIRAWIAKRLEYFV